LSNPQQKSQLAVIFMTVFIYLLGFGIIIPIIPILSRDFGATPTQTGLLMSIYSLAQFLFSPFWGRLSDRLGRRPILMFCLFCESLSYLLFAFADNLVILFMARGLAGFFGASISTASAAISDITTEQNRSKGMALIGVAFGLGFVFGPALGGLLASVADQFSQAPHFKTRFASSFVALICLITFVFAWFKLKETIKEKRRDDSSPKIQRFKRIFQSLQIPTLGPLMIVFFLVSIAMSAMESTLILYMADKFQWGIVEVSFGFVWIGVILVFTQGFLVRRMIPRWGERHVLPAGLICFVLGLGLIPLSNSIPLLAVAMTLLSIGYGLSNPSILGSVSLLTASQEQGEKLGITQSLSSLGRILGPAIGGYAFGHWMIQAPFILSSVMAFLGLAICIKIFNRIPEHGKKTGATP